VKEGHRESETKTNNGEIAKEVVYIVGHTDHTERGGESM
jgi:hypothetical protein